MLDNVSPLAILDVEGPLQLHPHLESVTTHMAHLVSLFQASHLLHPLQVIRLPSMFRSVTAPKRPSSFTMKVDKALIAKKNGRRKMHIKSDPKQTFIELVTPHSQPRKYFTNIIQKRWGPEYCLVTNDAIERKQPVSIKHHTQSTQQYTHIHFRLGTKS